MDLYILLIKKNYQGEVVFILHLILNMLCATLGGRYFPQEEHMSYMHACHLKKPLNIFNPHNRMDEALFRKSKDISQEEFNKLKEEHWLQLMRKHGREKILNHLRNLGYEGFFNFEHNKGEVTLDIFDADNISISKIHKGYNEIDDFIRKIKS